jgi:hypothetical protein
VPNFLFTKFKASFPSLSTDQLSLISRVQLVTEELIQPLLLAQNVSSLLTSSFARTAPDVFDTVLYEISKTDLRTAVERAVKMSPKLFESDLSFSKRIINVVSEVTGLLHSRFLVASHI